MKLVLLLLIVLNAMFGCGIAQTANLSGDGIKVDGPGSIKNQAAYDFSDGRNYDLNPDGS